jgi:hypothetical protein
MDTVVHHCNGEKRILPRLRFRLHALGLKTLNPLWRLALA